MFDVQSWLDQHKADGVNLSVDELLFYRHKTMLMDLTPKLAIQAKLSGTYLAKSKGRGMEFDEARHYQPGDDIRAIDWRVTARTGKTHTKIYREEKERPVFILCDLSNSMHFGSQLMFKSVQAAHLASLIAWSAAQKGDRVGGLIFNAHQHHELKPFTRQKAVLNFIHSLIELHQPNSQNSEVITFSDSCARLRRLAKPGSLVCIISDFQSLNEQAKQHIAKIGRHCEVICYPISDALEHQLPKVRVAQEVAVTDGSTDQVIMLGEKHTEEEYRLACENRLQRIHQTLAQCKTKIFPIEAGKPIEDHFVGDAP
jgi:uncharacterized protein (DUF58 family)